MEGCEIIKRHDDGDLTVQCGTAKFVLTSEGEVFREMDLVLHSVPEAEGLGGIVVNPEIASQGPCTCYDNICFHKGIIGALSSAERATYCKEVVEGTSPGMKRRLVKWREAKEVCKAKAEGLPKGEKLQTYISCMGIELGKRGIEV